MNSPDIAPRLQTLVQRCVADADGVVAIRRVSGGASQEIWSFDATTPAGPVPLILRRARRWSVEAQAGCAGMDAEAVMLIAASEGGVPVPQVRYVLKPDAESWARAGRTQPLVVEASVQRHRTTGVRVGTALARGSRAGAQ